MKIIPKLRIVSVCIKTFLDDPQWPKHIKDPSLEANQEFNFIEYIRILKFF